MHSKKKMYDKLYEYKCDESALVVLDYSLSYYWRCRACLLNCNEWMSSIRSAILCLFLSPSIILISPLLLAPLLFSTICEKYGFYRGYKIFGHFVDFKHLVLQKHIVIQTVDVHVPQNKRKEKMKLSRFDYKNIK